MGERIQHISPKEIDEVISKLNKHQAPGHDQVPARMLKELPRKGFCPKSNMALQKKKGVVMWDLEGPIRSGYLVHCSYPFFMSIRIKFSVSYSMLSQSLVTPTSLARFFINPEFCQCPLRHSCQLQLF